jgi:putative ABC transport system permease protein
MFHPDSLKQDFHFAFRILRKRPGYTLFAVVLLGLIVGVNGAVFSIINGVLLRPLPLPESGRLVAIWENNARKSRQQEPVSLPDFSDWREHTRTLSQIAAMRTKLVDFGAGDQKSEARAGVVTDSFFSLLQVSPVVGRTFQKGDDVAQGDRLAVLSESFWASRFGRDSNIVGRSVVVDDALFTIIGVAPDVEIPNMGHPDLWLTMFAGFSRQLANLNDRSYRFLAVMGRIASGVGQRQVQAELDTVSANLAKQFPTTNEGEGAVAISLLEQATGSVREPLLVLWAAVGLLLLLGCANIANLIVAHALARRRETAVRLALGCSRGRLTLQLLIENGLVAFAGGVFGTILAFVLLGALARLAPQGLPRLSEVRLDAGTFLFIMAITSLTTIVFGLVPALAARNTNAMESLKDGRQVAGGFNRFIGFGLMGSEIVLSLVMFIGAGLAVRSFVALSSVRLGFSPDRVLTANLVPTGTDPAQLSITYDNILSRLGAVPGINSAGASQALPFGASNWMTSFAIVGQATEANRPVTGYGRVAGDYFSTMRIGLIAGRYLTSVDRRDSPHVAVVNEAFVTKYLRSENPLGKRLAIWDGEAPYEIVGVVANTTQRRLEVSNEPVFYIPYAQHPQGTIGLAVRTEGDPGALSTTVRQEIKTAAPSVRVQALTTMENQLSSYLAVNRYSSLLLTSISIIAGLISALGIYAVTSRRAVQRKPELAIRVALGATPASVVSLVLLECIRVTGCAIVLGLGAAAMLSRLMRGFIYGVRFLDPLTFMAAPLLILMVSAAAAYFPSRRASHVDPLEGLRAE